MFENQPKGLWALALANTGERFGYYTMLAVFLLYLQANFGFETGLASTIYSTFLMMVYFLPIIGVVSQPTSLALDVWLPQVSSSCSLAILFSHFLLARKLLPLLPWVFHLFSSLWEPVCSRVICR